MCQSCLHHTCVPNRRTTHINTYALTFAKCQGSGTFGCGFFLCFCGDTNIRVVPYTINAYSCLGVSRVHLHMWFCISTSFIMNSTQIIDGVKVWALLSECLCMCVCLCLKWFLHEIVFHARQLPGALFFLLNILNDAQPHTYRYSSKKIKHVFTFLGVLLGIGKYILE